MLVSLDVAQRDAEAQRTEVEIRGRRRIYTILLLAVFACMLFARHLPAVRTRRVIGGSRKTCAPPLSPASQKARSKALVAAMEAAQSSKPRCFGPAWEGLCAASAELYHRKSLKDRPYFAHWPGSVTDPSANPAA